MAETYDNDTYKRIWPPILVPREVLQKYADVHHGGNTKKALSSMTKLFSDEDSKTLEQISEDIVGAHEQHLVAVAEREKIARENAPAAVVKPTKEEKAAAKLANKEAKAAAKKSAAPQQDAAEAAARAAEAASATDDDPETEEEIAGEE